MITSGKLPHEQAFVIRVGEPQGRFLPVVGTIFKPNRENDYFAGAAEIRGDKIHFAPESWERKPLTLQAAVSHANEKAYHENFVDSIVRSVEHGD